jgi:hypothetical protein
MKPEVFKLLSFYRKGGKNQLGVFELIFIDSIPYLVLRWDGDTPSATYQLKSEKLQKSSGFPPEYSYQESINLD